MHLYPCAHRSKEGGETSADLSGHRQNEPLLLAPFYGGYENIQQSGYRYVGAIELPTVHASRVGFVAQEMAGYVKWSLMNGTAERRRVMGKKLKTNK